MRKLKHIIVLLTIALLANSCKDTCYTTRKEMVSVADYAEANMVLNTFQVQAPRGIAKPGNIYTYGNYLLVCEHEQGIHILDNTNPSAPIALKYIKLVGNDNIAVKDHFLYADNGTDLLAIDINDLDNITVANKVENAFPERLKDGKILVGYHIEEKTVKVPCNSNRGTVFSPGRQDMMASGAEASGVTGKGGSMARFVVADNFLYIAKADKFVPYNLATPSNPKPSAAQGFPAQNIETCFQYKDNLFFGASDGVYIYNYKSSPESPSYVSEISHVMGCDPVVVQNDYLFSTVRGGSMCRTTNSVNLLYLYDIKNITSPNMVATENQQSPYGLGVNGQLLVVCNGINGMMVYNWEESSQKITLRSSYPDIHAFDVIMNGNTMIVTADNGLFQFDCTDPSNIKYLSTLVKFK